MTKAQKELRDYVMKSLEIKGVSAADAAALRRISMTLHRWHEHECNGTIQRDDETCKPFWYSTATYRRLCAAIDRETGALKRLAAIMARYPDLVSYVQGDPRGVALYVLSRDQVGERDIDAIYGRGVAVF